jgi:hypothetical protein
MINKKGGIIKEKGGIIKNYLRRNGFLFSPVASKGNSDIRSPWAILVSCMAIVKLAIHAEFLVRSFKRVVRRRTAVSSDLLGPEDTGRHPHAIEISMAQAVWRRG